MKKYGTDSTKKFGLTFFLLVFGGILLGWLDGQPVNHLLRALIIGVPSFSVLLLIEYFFTYLKVDETKHQVTASSFPSLNRVKIDSITRITKEPHPIFKGASWAIFIHYKDKKGKEKHFEIWPSFSPETMGKFLSDLQHLNLNIQFDEGSKEWIKQYGNA